jgi:O-antigen/teichoic acid export membrane protein
MRSFYRNIISVLGSNAFAFITSIGIGIIISRFLGPEGRGIYELLMVIPTIFVLFVKFGARQSVIFHIGIRKFSLKAISDSIFLIFFISSFLGIVATFISFIYLKPTDTNWIMMALAILTIPVRLSLVFSRGFFLGNNFYKQANFLKWAPVVFNFFSLLVFIWLFRRHKIEASLFALFTSNILLAFYALKEVFKEVKPAFKFNKKAFNSVLKLGFTYALSLLILQLNYRLDIIILYKLQGFKDVGFYTLGVHFAEVLWEIPMIMSLIVISRSNAESSYSRLNETSMKLLRVSLVAAFGLGLVVYFFAPYIIPFFYGSAFRPSITLARMLLPATFIFIVFRVLTNRLAADGKMHTAMLTTILMLGLNVYLNFLWIPIHGPQGAAYATFASYIFGTLMIIVVYSLKMRTSILKIFLFQKSDFNFIKRWFVKLFVG